MKILRIALYAAVLMSIGLSGAAGETILQKASGTRLERQKHWQMQFDLTKQDMQNKFIRLEFDGRIDFPELSGHNATAMTVYINDKPIPADRMVNCPIEFRRANGKTGEAGRWRAPRWNYETRKTGRLYEDIILKNGGDAYGLVYSPDFDLIDSKKYAYRSPGFSRKHFVFDLSGMVTEGKNTVTIYNLLTQDAVEAMGNKAPLTLEIKDVKVYSSTQKISKPLPFWLAEFDELNQQMPYVEPIRNWREDFSYNVTPQGLLTVRVGKKQYQVISRFSYPNKVKSQNGFPRPFTAQKEWKVQKKSAADGAVELAAAGSFYRVERNIAAHENYLEISDTVTNTTDEKQPVFIRHIIRMKNRAHIYLSGLKVEPGQNAQSNLPENPTAFAEAADGSGIGVTPYDDILRLHGSVFQNGRDMELRDQQLVLAPRKSVKLVWQIFPVNQGGYMRFVNNVRHAWKLQSPEVNGCIWNHILKPVAANWKPKFGVDTVSIFNTFKGRSLWGTAVEGNLEYEQEKLQIIDSIRKLHPQLKIMASYMAIYFSNICAADQERFKDLVIINKNGTYPTEGGCRFYIPSRNNEFGKMVEKNIDRMIDVWKVDGIYFDYMEGADAYYTYNQYDGVSGDIREADGSLQAVKGSYQLLSQDFLIYLVKKIHSKGLFVRANRNNFTASTMNQINDIVPIRFTECGYPDQLTRGQLAPCPMGLQRTLSNKLELQTLRALYEGLTTSPYHTAYKHRQDDNPVSAMWPIAYREMRRGVVIGENKIVTAVSGHFGFGDASKLAVRFYNQDGLRTRREFPQVVKDGKNYVSVKLKTGEIAVIDRVK